VPPLRVAKASLAKLLRLASKIGDARADLIEAARVCFLRALGRMRRPQCRNEESVCW
jgi:hypothetical protein